MTTLSEIENKNNWVYEEFKNLSINCGKIINRFIRTMITLSNKPDMSIAAASSGNAESQAIYRLLKNKKLTDEVILSSHKKQTIKVIQESGENIILCIQDTSEINYTTLKGTDGLGEYGGMENSRGLIVHSSIATRPDGIVLGLLDQDIWAREPSERGKSKKRSTRPIEEKESYKWIESMEKSNKGIPEDIKVVNVCDREADIFEFFDRAIEQNKFFLVRAVHNRKILEESKLFDLVNNEKSVGEVVVKIPRDTRRNIKKRESTLEIKYVKVTLPTPAIVKKMVGKAVNLEITIILAKEKNPPKGQDPIEWYLVTNLEVSNFDEAVEKVRWYVQRWKIERFHYVLKSGCKIEELQERDAKPLMKLILMYSIIAIRILYITYVAREDPELSCEEVFEEEEWKVLYCIANKTTIVPIETPTMHDAVGYLAKIGGFLGRKEDGEPGAKVIWRGLKELNIVLKYYKYFTPSNYH